MAVGHEAVFTVIYVLMSHKSQTLDWSELFGHSLLLTERRAQNHPDWPPPLSALNTTAVELIQSCAPSSRWEEVSKQGLFAFMTRLLRGLY